MLARLAPYALLACLALSIDTIGGLGNYPPFATSDEVSAGLEARTIALDEPLGWLTPWNQASGYEHMAQVPLRAAQALFGPTLEGGRMAHVFFGALLVVGVYGAGRHLVDRYTALVAAALLAVSHLHIALSRAYLCTGIQTAAASVLMLWLLLSLRRYDGPFIWAPRVLLMGAILGWGVQTYKLGYGLPPLVIGSIFLRRRVLPAQWWEILAVMLIPAIALTAQWAAWLWAHYPDSFEHVGSLFLTPQDQPVEGWVTKLAILGSQMHRAASLWWTGRDGADNYGATIPALDPVTGIAFAAGLAYVCVLPTVRQLRAHAVWWLPVLMLGTIGLVNNGAGYYRLSLPLVWVCWISAVGVTHWCRGILGRAAPFGMMLIIGVAAYLNLTYYFVDYPREVGDGNLAKVLVTVRNLCASNEATRTFPLPDADYDRRLLRLECRP